MALQIPCTFTHRIYWLYKHHTKHIVHSTSFRHSTSKNIQYFLLHSSDRGKIAVSSFHTVLTGKIAASFFHTVLTEKLAKSSFYTVLAEKNRYALLLHSFDRKKSLCPAIGKLPLPPPPPTHTHTPPTSLDIRKDAGTDTNRFRRVAEDRSKLVWSGTYRHRVQHTDGLKQVSK